jgi:hypothetical protein
LFVILAYNLYQKFTHDSFINAIDEFKAAFSFSKIHFLLIAVGLTFVNWGLETLKFYTTIQRVQKLSYFTAYRGILYGNALNLILPASIGELTGRPLVLKEANRAQGSGVAYYVSIVQKVASPFVGLCFFALAAYMGFVNNKPFTLFGFSFSIFLGIIVISIIDLLFWAYLFFKPKSILHLLEKIKFLENIFKKIEHALDFSNAVKWKLVAIGASRFFVFVTQYWILTFLFFNDFPHFEFYVLSGVYFLAQFVIPSLGVSDIMLRATLVSIVFENHIEGHIVQLLAINILIWIINVLIPSLFGFWLMRKNIV